MSVLLLDPGGARHIHGEVDVRFQPLAPGANGNTKVHHVLGKVVDR